MVLQHYTVMIMISARRNVYACMKGKCVEKHTPRSVPVIYLEEKNAGT